MLWRNGIQKPSKLRFRSFSEKAFFFEKEICLRKTRPVFTIRARRVSQFYKSNGPREKKILYENIHIFSPILHIIIFLALNSMEAPKGNWSLFRPSIHAFTTSATTSSALAKSFRKESLESCIWSLAQVWKLQFFLSQINSAFYFEIFVK